METDIKKPRVIKLFEKFNRQHQHENGKVISAGGLEVIAS